MRYLVSSSPSQTIVLARQKLGLTQKEMAAAVGSSTRTVTRWESRESTPADFHFHKLAALLHPVDAALAHDAALAGGKTLEQLGIVAAPPPPAPPEPAPAHSAAPSASRDASARHAASPAAPPLLPRLLVDAVVYAGLEALEGVRIPLGTVRAVLFAAFARARDLRLDAGEVADALARPAPEPPAVVAPAPAPLASSAAAAAPPPAEQAPPARPPSPDRPSRRRRRR